MVMSKQIFFLPVSLMLLLLIGCSSEAERGDYIFSKKMQDDIPRIEVVLNITKQEALNKSIDEFLNNDDPDDVIIYHVRDKNVYDDLQLGERITVKSASGYTMLSAPPQKIADEIIRYSEKK